MPESESIEKQKAAIMDTLKVIDLLLILTDQAHKSGELLQLSVAVAQSDALKIQLGNITDMAVNNETKSLAATKLSEMVNRYHELPAEILDVLRQRIFELFPEKPERMM